jgi:hypothetical protein
MTRAERRTRQRTRELAAGNLRHETRRTPASMLDNPNSGKRHTARLDTTGQRAERAIVAARNEYRPLTVHTPILRARKSPRTTSYTI